MRRVAHKMMIRTVPFTLLLFGVITAAQAADEVQPTTTKPTTVRQLDLTMPEEAISVEFAPLEEPETLTVPKVDPVVANREKCKKLYQKAQALKDNPLQSVPARKLYQAECLAREP